MRAFEQLLSEKDETCVIWAASDILFRVRVLSFENRKRDEKILFLTGTIQTRTLRNCQ